jgi:LacI family transcriptional regulator
MTILVAPGRHYIMNTRATIADIAKVLHVTPATVSRALNDHPGISQETKKAVREVAERLQYKRNKIASSLRSGKSNMIGVIIPSAAINFFGEVVHGIEAVAGEHGYSVLLYQSNELPEFERKGIEALISAGVDGILASLAKGTVDFGHYLSLEEHHIPLVFFDRANDALGIPSVVVDDFKGAYRATQHLIEQGYLHIAHISGQQHLSIFRNRLEGYKAALMDAGLPVREEWIFQGDVSIEAGRKAVKYFMALSERPDAIFAVEDYTALGAVKELKEEHIRIPEDVGIVGFANEDFGEHITPSLSTINQQPVSMGKEAFRLLYNLMGEKKGQVTETVTNKVMLEPNPIFRQSSLRK